MSERTLIYIGDGGERGCWLDCSENAKGWVTDPQPGDLVYVHLSSPQCQEDLLQRGLRLVRAGNGYARIVRLPDEET